MCSERYMGLSLGNDDSGATMSTIHIRINDDRRSSFHFTHI